MNKRRKISLIAHSIRSTEGDLYLLTRHVRIKKILKSITGDRPRHFPLRYHLHFKKVSLALEKFTIISEFKETRESQRERETLGSN